MKTLSFCQIIVLCVISLLFSCSSDDTTSTPSSPSTEVTSINLSLNKEAVEVGEQISATVIANTGQNLTNQSTIIVNGTAMNGTTFIADQEGDYIVRARYGTLESNAKTITATNAPISSLQLQLSKTEAYWGETIQVSIVDNFSRDQSNTATVFVNGSSIPGNTFTANENVTWEVYATHDGVTSNTETVSFSQPPTSYKKNVLIEDFTGTWCGNCPRVKYALELLEMETEDLVVIEHHGGNGDPFVRINSTPLRDAYNLGSNYPDALVDREFVWSFPEAENVQEVLNVLGDPEGLGLSVNSTINGNIINADVTVAFGQDYNQDLNLIVILVEDNLIWDQTNYFDSLYDGQNPIVDFEYNGVASQLYTDLFGDNIPVQTLEGSEYSTSFSVEITNQVFDPNQLSIIAFVTESSTNHTINVRKGVVGETAGFQFFE